MGKKIVKALACVMAVVLMVAALWLGNGFFGNPVSALMARNALNRYLRNTYSHMPLETERFGYDFKSGGYFAYMTSPESRDTAFYIDLDMLGHVTHDSFDTWVTGRLNTERRVQEQYRILADSVLKADSFPYQSDIRGAMLDFQQDRETEDDRDYSYAIAREELIPDKEYTEAEIREFGKRAGILTIYVEEDTVTAQRAAQIMLDIRKQFDVVGIPFYRMDFVLQYPISEDGSPRPEGDIRAELLYTEIVEEGLPQRILESHRKICDRYARWDQEKEGNF